MELNLKGDYYEWYCDWCDTRNLTLIHRVADGTFSCCACHKMTSMNAMNWQDHSDASCINKVYQQRM
jgi:hypothetical protein